MSNNSVIEHRACYHFIKVEEDYIAICSNGKRSPHCKALILAILESWANTKGKGKYVYMSFPQWIKATYMLYERNVIVDCLVELLEEKMILRNSIIMNDQKTFEYRLNIDIVQNLIKQLPAKDNENLPNLTSYLAFKERGKTERAKKKEEGVVEKSHTSQKSKGVSEKSHTPVEKSQTVSEKSTAVEHGGYVKNQRNLDSNYIDTHLDKNIDCNSDTASADVTTTAHTSPLSEKNHEEETTPPTEQKPEETTTPTVKETARRRSPASGKSKRTKKNEIAETLALSEIPAPQKPDPKTHPYNVELFMKLGDYYRGSELVVSNNPNSRYQKALAAAKALIQRKAPFERIDKLFCFMLGRGEEIGLPKLRDEKWIKGCYNTDLWVVESHYTDKWLECQQMEQALRGITKSEQPIPGNGMTHDEAQGIVQDAIEKGKQHGYDIKAQAYADNGVWLVKINWDGSPLTMKSRSEWNSEFAEIHEMEQELAKKGAK